MLKEDTEMEIQKKEIEKIELLYELYGFSKVKQSEKFIVFT